MTNEQLVLLIRAWCKRLNREIDLLRDDLPADLGRERVKQFTGQSGVLGAFLPHAEDYQEVDGDYLILAGLKDLAQELEEALSTLGGGE